MRGGVCCVVLAAWMPPWPTANMHAPAGQAKRERGRKSGEENCARKEGRTEGPPFGRSKARMAEREGERRESDERKQRAKVSLSSEDEM